MSAVTPPEHGSDLLMLMNSGTTEFLALCVVIPSLLGIVSGWLLGQERVRALKPMVRIANSLILLVLCYTNASDCLPRVLADPDWDFLVLTLAVVTSLSVLGFAVGALVSYLLGTTEAERASLMFGLGMTNNGTGLVIAAKAFAELPMALLPILGYNLVQHLVAGLVSARLSSRKA
jgi:BASS family bile acid:Na+ symporter